MSRDPHCPPHRSDGSGDLPPGVGECASLGERLSRTPLAERDLAWHIMAYHVGDLGALASARLRSHPTRGAGH